MKKSFALCCVISLVTIANGFPTDEDKNGAVIYPNIEPEMEFDFFVFNIAFLPITEEQIQCIQERLQKVADDNPELKWWFDEVEKSATELIGIAKKCESFAGVEQKTCYFKLKVAVRVALVRLVQMLPADSFNIVEQFKSVIRECLE